MCPYKVDNKEEHELLICNTNTPGHNLSTYGIFLNFPSMIDVIIRILTWANISALLNLGFILLGWFDFSKKTIYKHVSKKGSMVARG